jgi:hypothetical protein
MSGQFRSRAVTQVGRSDPMTDLCQPPYKRGVAASRNHDERRRSRSNVLEWGPQRIRRLTATMTATATVNARRGHAAAARHARASPPNWGTVRPEKRKVGGPTPPLTTTTSDQRRCLVSSVQIGHLTAAFGDVERRVSEANR